MSEIVKKTILVVEDEPAYKRTLNEKLNSEGFDVISAADGEEGLKMALDKHPDLILLDLQMPKMNGIEMAKKLRMDEWGKSAKVIVLTNLTDLSKTEQVMESDIFYYLIKTDTKLEDLIIKIREMTK